MRLLTLSFLFMILSTNTANANSFETFKKTWKFFKEECQLVLKNPYSYIKGEGGSDEKITVKISEDKKVYVINKGKGKLNNQVRYLEAFIDIYTDREFRSCSVYYSKWKSFVSKELAKKIVPWLSEQGFEVVGGYVPMYDKSTHQFGVFSAWPDKHLPIRIRLIAGEMQFFIEDVVGR